MEPAGELPSVVATLRELVARSGALRAILLLDRGEREPVLVDLGAGGELEVAAGEHVRSFALDALGDARPLELPGDLRSFPPAEVDPERGTVTSALGALDHTARGVRAAAALFGGRSVLTVAYPTTDPHAPLFLAARVGEPLVVMLGDHDYELPGGWPE